MVLRTATKDENVPRPRTLIMVAARDRGRATLGSRTRPQRSPGSCAIRKVGRDQADEKRSNGNLTPGQVDWKGRSVEVDRSQGRANESTDPVAPSRIGDFAVPSETTKQPSQGNEDQRSRKLVNAGLS